jgi:zinc protease
MYTHTSMKPRMFARAAVAVPLAFLAPSLGAQTAPDRSAPPELGPPPSLRLPPVDRFELPNGLPVILMEKHGVPIVQVKMLIRAGSVDDPSGKTGLASMTAAMLDEGAGELDALALADAIDFLGADLEVGSGLHTTGIYLFTPVSQLEPALALMADVVLRPTFPAAEIERLRTERLTGLLQARDEPRAIAVVQFDDALFGDEHPYGAFVDEASLRALTRADLVNFHGTRYRPDNAVLIVVGDVNAADMRPMLTAAFGGWEPGGAAPAKVDTAPQVTGRTVYLVDKPGAAQSEIRIGRIGAPRVTEDYFALMVMNTILGGSFTSRLNSNLREDKGYSYGAGSRFDMRPVAGPFQAGAAVQTEVTDKALVEFMKELTEISQTVTEEELERARNYVALRFPGRFQTVAGIADQLGEAYLYDLPPDYFNDYVEDVLAVSMEDVNRVAKEYVDPENMAIIVVGDLETIEPGVRALSLGDVEILTVEDVLGPAPSLGAAD